MANRTTNGHFSIDFLGHVQTEQELAKNFEALDAQLGPVADPEAATIIIVAPAPEAADIGKVLGLVDDGQGNPVVGWVAA